MTIQDLIEQIESIFDYKISLSANLNQVSSLLFYGLPSVSWAGFYIKNGDHNCLKLGAFVGRVACTVIPFDKGVVGHCYTKNTAIVVNDVHKFKDHIACDSAAKSEICIPIRVNDEVWAVMDLDSEEESRFNAMDVEFAEVGDVVSKLVAKYLEDTNC